MAIQFSNLASTSLASGVSSSATSISVTSASSFPSLGSGDYFYATLGAGTGSEIVKVTAISGTTFTVVRGQDGTTAVSHSAGGDVALRVTAGTLEDLRDGGQVYTAGSGLGLSGNEFTNTAPDQTVSISGSGSTTVTGTYPSFTVSSTSYSHPSAHPISFITGLQTALDGKVDDSQVLTDVPANALFTDTVYTLPFTDNSSNWNTAYGWGDHSTAGYLTSHQSLSGYATETYVGTQITNLVDSAPATMDTLNELAAALGDDPNFATTVSTSIGTKLPLAGGTLTGALSGTTASFSGNLTSSGYLNVSTIYNTGDYRILNNGGTAWHDVVTRGNGDNYTVNALGGFKVGSTTVIDSSRTHFSGIKGYATTATGNTSITASTGIKQTYSEGWTAIFADYDPHHEWGLYHDNPSNYFLITGGVSTNNIGSFSVVNHAGSTRTAYTKIRLDQNTGEIRAGGGYYVGNTQVLDTSRNLTNIGNATFSGSVTAPSIDSQQYRLLQGSVTAGGIFKERTITGAGVSNDVSIFAESISDGGEIHFMTGGSATKKFTFTSGGNFQVGGTTVIDSSRNLTNIGTISSGAQTLVANATIIESLRNPSTSWGEYALTRYGTEGANFRYMDFGYYRGTTEATRGLVIKSQAFSTLFTFLDSGEFQVGTTTVIDSSRNLTVATGASSGKFAVMASSPHGTYDFYNNGTTYLNGSTIVDDALNLTGGNAKLQIGGTTVIDSSREIKFTKGSSGTLASRTGFSDFIGYNPSYGSYFGGGANNGNSWIYSGGYIDQGGVHTLWHSGNDGSGSGLDADTVDGNHASSFLTTASDSEQVAHFGEVYYNNGSARISSDPRVNSGGYDSDNLNIHWYSTTATGANYGRVGHALYNGSAYQYLHTQNNSNNIYINNNVIWHAGNDGSGSGLDADLLDGNNSGAFLKSGAGDSVSGWWISAARNGNSSGTMPHIYLSHSGGFGMHINTYNTSGSVYALELHNNSNELFAVRNNGDIKVNGTTRMDLSGNSYFDKRRRFNHHTGHLEGSYNNVGSNSAKSNPIYTIGSSYNPVDASLANMYGIGFTSTGASFISGGLSFGDWGMYVAADGDARIFMDGSGGKIAALGEIRGAKFGDINDTGYYVDPASTGISANFNGRIQVGTFAPSQSNSGEAWIGRATDRVQGTLSVQLGTGSGRKFEVVDAGWTTVEFSADDSGNATAASSMRAPVFYDSANTGYYVDPLQTSSMNYIVMPHRSNGTENIKVNNGQQENWRAINVAMGGSNNAGIGYGNNTRSVFNRHNLAFHVSQYDSIRFHSDGWDTLFEVAGASGEAWLKSSLKATLFYDRDNTGYYLNPASVSNLNSIDVIGTLTPMGKIDLPSGSASGTTFGASHYSMGVDYANGGWSHPNYSDLIIGYHTGIRIGAGYSGIRFYNNSPTTDTDNTGNGNGGEALLMTIGGGGGASTGADVQVRNRLLVGGSLTNNAYNSISSTRLLFGGGDDPDNYHIGTSLENYGGNYTKLDLRWHTGIRIGAQAQYGGVRIFNSEDLSTVLFSVGKGDTHTRVESGSLYAGEYYDLQNSAFYINGDGQSSLKTLKVAGTANTTFATPNIMSYGSSNSGGVANYHMRFVALNGNSNGNISTNYYQTTYATTSDYRVKEDLQPMLNATGRLMALNPVNFQWKDSDMRTDGFLAHEVAEVVSDAVVGEKDAVDEKGNDELQSLDQSKLVPLLVKTIQEQQSVIEALEARISALEA